MPLKLLNLPVPLFWPQSRMLVGPLAVELGQSQFVFGVAAVLFVVLATQRADEC